MQVEIHLKNDVSSLVTTRQDVDVIQHAPEDAPFDFVLEYGDGSDERFGHELKACDATINRVVPTR